MLIDCLNDSKAQCPRGDLCYGRGYQELRRLQKSGRSCGVARRGTKIYSRNTSFLFFFPAELYSALVRMSYC